MGSYAEIGLEIFTAAIRVLERHGYIVVSPEGPSIDHTEELASLLLGLGRLRPNEPANGKTAPLVSHVRTVAANDDPLAEGSRGEWFAKGVAIAEGISLSEAKALVRAELRRRPLEDDQVEPEFPRCPECGGRVVLTARPGRTRELEKGVFVEIPSDVEIPTCTACGEESMAAEISEALDARLSAALRKP